MEENKEIEPNGDKKTYVDILRKIFVEIAEWVICFIIAYILYLFLNYFVGTISGVKQVSMYPTTKEGERLIIERPTIMKKDFEYGDIITFEAPSASSDNYNVDLNAETVTTSYVAKYPAYTGFNKFLHDFIGIDKISYIKRVIGLPGDHIYISEDGDVYRNDEKLKESYIKDGLTSRTGKYINVIVPEGAVFVMGDNRLESKDSRVFGCIPMSKINGYVVCRIWPLNRLGKLDG